MSVLMVFLIGFLFSYIGSIPPGTINITTLQYAIQGKKQSALIFGFAAAFIEFFYAGAAVKFQIFLTESTSAAEYFKWISGSVLLILGAFNLIKKKTEKAQKTVGEKRSAFKKGVLISLANPMAMPFWLMVTAYLQGVGWLMVTDQNILFYILGISTGTFALLASVTSIGEKFSMFQHNEFVIYRVPGMIFVAMGVWSFVQ